MGLQQKRQLQRQRLWKQQKHSKARVVNLCDGDSSSEKVSNVIKTQIEQTVIATKGLVAGRLKKFVNFWENMTLDPNILDMVSGCHLEFVDGTAPVQHKPPKPLPFNRTEKEIIHLELATLIKKGVVEPAEHCIGEFISNIFIRKKRDGTFRTIFNLKQFNESIPYHHFKMETLQSAIKLMRPNCFMASVDLKDAYYTVPIAQEHRKFLKFMWENQLYQYTCLPNGLACAPRKFTKLLKPIFALLRKMGFLNTAYIDDSYLQGDTKEECGENIEKTVCILSKAGFLTHPVKSVFVPTQQLVFLGFVLDSMNMAVRLTAEKAQRAKQMCIKLNKCDTCTIQTAAETVGTLVSSFPGVEMGPLFYRRLEMAKAAALRDNFGNFNAIMELSNQVKEDLTWWINNVCLTQKCISHGKPDLLMWSDASNLGWGAKCETETAGGRWSRLEQEEHINCKELMAGLFAVKCFCAKRTNLHVRLYMDNTTAVAYVNAMGGTKSKKCNVIARQIWIWCMERQIWLSAAHIAGKANVDADYESRVFNDRTEWKLDNMVFKDIAETWGTPKIDLFASRLNAQVKTFVSWKPDPDAAYVDAFTLTWTDSLLYIFPPFSLVGRCLQKLEEDGGECILVAPVWTTQPWYSKLLQMITAQPLLLPPSRHLLTLPGTDKQHTLQKLVLAAFRLSGNQSAVKEFQKKLPSSSWHLGEALHTNSMRPTYRNGFTSVVKNKLIVFNRL